MPTNVSPGATTPNGRASRVATKIRLHPDTLERARYWTERTGLSSVNEFMALAVEEKISRMNGDYDLPSLEIARLNQLIDEIRALSVNTTNLERVVVSGFDSLIGLTRGDAAYLQDEDGDLDVGDAFAGEVSVDDDFGGEL